MPNIKLTIDDKRQYGARGTLEYSLSLLKHKLSKTIYEDLIVILADETRKLMKAWAPVKLGGYPASGGWPQDPPRESGTLIEGIVSTTTKGFFQIESEAIDPWTGKDYAPTQEYGFGVPATQYFSKSLDFLESVIQAGLDDILDYTLEHDKVPSANKIRKMLGFGKARELAGRKNEASDHLRDVESGINYHDRHGWGDELDELSRQWGDGARGAGLRDTRG